jgi:cysteinyl-tRNA synthetase
MHNGYVMVEGEKMSKSLGNFRTVHDLRDQWPGEVIRMVLLSAQYRQPLDFTEDGLRQAKASLDRLYGALRHQVDTADGPDVLPLAPDDPVIRALNDDLNTPQAMAALHETAGAVNRASGDEARRLVGLLRSQANHMGLLTVDPEAWFQQMPAADGPGTEEIEAMIVARQEARKTRDFKEADRIRDTLADQGVILEDGPTGTTWKRN